MRARTSPIDSPAVRRCSIDSSLRRGVVAHDGAVDVVHDVEGCAVDRLVLAEADGVRDGYVGGAEGRDDPVLASHVVGGGQDLAQRRPAEHPAAALGVGDGEGEVGPSAGDEVVAQRR
ncbi:MAG: hypothetical protein U5R31_00365 [Acidimicrobiia bacterium]|nr:hypothetical protein [Acidimicrobiia bacterium]